MTSQSIVRQTIWRRQLRNIIGNLKRKWLSGGELSGSGLLADLFDEAVNDCYLLEPLVSTEIPWVGIDKLMETAGNAGKRVCLSGGKRPNIAVCDVRRLAFQEHTFDYVLSHSTLDHFGEQSDIRLAIREIYRVMKPGAVLIITLDNPKNPIVFLRNLIPLVVLRMVNIVPYGVGKTIPLSQFRSILEREHFTVQHSCFIDHGPRFVTIHLGRWFERNDRVQNLWSWFLGLAEKMASWPTFKQLRSGAVQAGMPGDAVINAGRHWYEVYQILQQDLSAGDVLLIKGRRTQRLDRVTLALQGRSVQCRVQKCKSSIKACGRCPMLERGWDGLRVTV